MLGILLLIVFVLSFLVVAFCFWLVTLIIPVLHFSWGVAFVIWLVMTLIKWTFN